MKALTVRQPYAGAILDRGKNVENRKQLWSYRGPLLIHSAHRLADATAFTEVEHITHTVVPTLGIPRAGVAWEVGAIIGAVDLVGAHRSTDCSNGCSPWAHDGHVHLELARPRILTRPVPCNGQLGLWTPDDFTAGKAREALR